MSSGSLGSSSTMDSNRERQESKIRILFISANPANTDRLKLIEEVKNIRYKIRAAEYRDQFQIEQSHEISLSDLQSELLWFKPHVVHFSGHGSKEGKLIFQNPSGSSEEASPAFLTRLFGLINRGASPDQKIGLLVLNACYSDIQARAICESVDSVVGTSAAIGDNDAIAFAGAFYEALAAGKDIETAFQLGQSALQSKLYEGQREEGEIRNVQAIKDQTNTPNYKMKDDSTQSIVKLIHKDEIDPSTIHLAKSSYKNTFEWTRISINTPSGTFESESRQPQKLQPGWWDPYFWWRVWWDPSYWRRNWE